MKRLLCILIVTASASNWYFGYTVGHYVGAKSVPALPSTPAAAAAPAPAPAPALPAKPKKVWRELDGGSMLPVREEYASKSCEQLDSLLLFGNETISLNLNKPKRK